MATRSKHPGFLSRGKLEYAIILNLCKRSRTGSRGKMQSHDMAMKVSIHNSKLFLEKVHMVNKNWSFEKKMPIALFNCQVLGLQNRGISKRLEEYTEEEILQAFQKESENLSKC